MDKFHTSGLSIFACACFLLSLPGSMLAQARPDAATSTGASGSKGAPATDGSQGISATRAPTGSATTKKVVAASLPLGMIKVDGGRVQLGISAKELEEIATKHGKTQTAKDIIRKRLTRELGDEKRPVQPFYLGKHEVTNRQYHVFIKATWPAHRFPFTWWTQADIDKKREEAHDKWEARKKAGERVPSFKFDVIDYWDTNWAKLEWELPEIDADKPVGFVTYDDARAFCTWAGVRLPTQAEWQLGFDGERYTWGKDWDPKHKLNKLERQPVAVGEGSFGANKLGFTEMMGNVWEWVDERFEALQGYDRARIELRHIWNRKKVDSRNFPTPVFGEKRIIMGGCAENWDEAPVAYRRQNRYALSEDNRAGSVGFRIAKSITPALDTTTLRYRYDFNKEILNGYDLDLPSIKDRKAMRAGATREFRVRGGERWDLVDGLIHGYHMVSVVPVKEVRPFGELIPKDEKAWKLGSAQYGTTGKHGLPLATIFTTEKIWFATKDSKGNRGKLELAPNIYSVFYRAKGINDELRYAMLAGGMELRSNKGKRKDDEQKKREEEEKKKALEKAAAKKGNTKKSKKKKKKKKKSKRKKKGRSANDSAKTKLIKDAMATWKEVVDAYEVDDKISKDYPKKKRPQLIRIQPGNLLIPVDRDILLIRDDKGSYIGWLPTRKTMALKSKGETKFTADPTSGKIQYASWMKFNDRKVLPFDFEFFMSTQELTKPWLFEK